MLSSTCKEPLVTLELPETQNLLNKFPQDPHFDITVILSSTRKNFCLQKKVLRQHSQYFRDYFTNDRTEDSKIMMITRKFDSSIFEKIIACCYGGSYPIFRDQEAYTAYHICAFLKIDIFTSKLEQVMVEKFDHFQFNLLYQISEMYHLISVKSKCLDYLESDPKAFKIILDLNQLHFHFIKTKQLFGSSYLNQSQFQTSGKPPTNLLLMLEEPFRNLIKLHNEYKQIQTYANSLLTYEEIYKILKLYVDVRSTSYEETKDKLREWVIELIDRSWLNSKQYRLIYHQELVIGHKNNDFDIYNQHDDQFITRSIKSTRDMILHTFDPLVSENYLLRKEMNEIRYEKDEIQLELRKERETQQISIRNSNKLQHESQRLQQQLEQTEKQYLQKMGYMERELVTLRLQLQTKEKQLSEKEIFITKLQSKLDDINRIQHEQLDITVESDLQIVKPQGLETSEIFQTSEPPKRESVSSNRQFIPPRYSIFGQPRRIIFDLQPRTVVNQNELDCLVEFFQLSIFEKMHLKLLYRGSRDSQDPIVMLKTCRFQQDLIILVRSWEHEKVFGLYINHEITKVEESFTDPKAFIFSVSHSRKFKQVHPAKFILDRNGIQVGADIKLFQNNECNFPVDFENPGSIFGPEFLSGDQFFLIEEIEVYKMSFSRAMEI